MSTPHLQTERREENASVSLPEIMVPIRRNRLTAPIGPAIHCVQSVVPAAMWRAAAVFLEVRPVAASLTVPIAASILISPLFHAVKSMESTLRRMSFRQRRTELGRNAGSRIRHCGFT